MARTSQRSDEAVLDLMAAARLANRVYEEELLPMYLGSCRGFEIVVDGLSGDHEVGRDLDDGGTAGRLAARQPDGVLFKTRVGKPLMVSSPLYPSWEEARNEWPWSQVPWDRPANEWPKKIKLLRE